MRKASRPIKGLLIDLEGVLFTDGQPIAGAVEALEVIRKQRIGCRFLTNTSTISRETLCDKLYAMGFSILLREIFSAPLATSLYLDAIPIKNCWYIVSDEVLSEFDDVQQSPGAVTHIVVGDIGSAWNHDLMNEIFLHMTHGAELIAMHKNRFWQTSDGLRLDIGAFISGLEYATRRTATVIGKPSTAFFELALLDMGLQRDQILVIGDDIDSDIAGARNTGLRSVLCKTGKYTDEYFIRSDTAPDHLIESFAELPALLASINQT